MTDRARRSGSWLAVAALLAGGCTAEFIVGESGGSSSTGSAADDGMAPATNADDGPVTDADASGGAETTSQSDTLPLDDTGAVESTSSAETGVTTGVETTAETGTPEGGVTDASAGEAGTTGEPVLPECAEVGSQADCQENWHCDWYGPEAAGNCWFDPCVDGADTSCNGLNNAQCLDAPLCTWVGDVEAGECAYTNCGALEMAACQEAPQCAWTEECIPIECPCIGLSMGDCLEGCQWVPEGEGFCSSS